MGLGRWGQRLVRSVQGRGSAIRFVAGCTGTPAKAEAFATQFGFALERDYAAVLARDDVDGVVIATPHDQHVGQIEAALRAGKHVFVEKPLASTCTEARGVVALAHKAGRVLAVGQNRRFLPAYRHLAALISNGVLGEIVHGSGTFASPRGWRLEPGTWRAKAMAEPAGSMAFLGIHVIDALVGLGLRFEQVTVVARRGLVPVPADDAVVAALESSGGASAVVSSLIATERYWRLEIFGAKGWAAMDGDRRTVWSAGGGVHVKEFPETDTERMELKAFAAAAGGGWPYPVGGEEAVQAIAVLEAIHRAAASNSKALLDNGAA